MKILHKTTGAVLWESDHKTMRGTLEAAVKAGASLDHASLDRASLVGASLVGASLDHASLDRASLGRASLDHASLVGASLVGASLDHASLVGASLDRASLVGASLVGASLDFSSGLPLYCGSFGVKIDRRIAAQLAYHFCRVDCDDPDYKAARAALLPLANTFHRVGECGRIEP